MSPSPGRDNSRLFLGALIAGLFPWLVVQFQMSLNGNVTWLLTAASRLLDGQSMSEGFFEVNPPLNILYNVPPVWLGRLLPLPLEFLAIFYFLALILISVLAANAVLRRWDFLETGQRHTLVGGFVIANTVLAAISVGEREQVVILGLLPFLLAQLSLTWGYALPRRLLWPVLAAGAAAALIKPHFGLLPVLLLLHRMIVQRRFFSVVRDPDFIALVVATIAYVAIVWFFFRDFVEVILPDVLALYAGNKHYQFALPLLVMHLAIFGAFFACEAAFSPLKSRQKTLLCLLYAGALVALIPFAVQMKAFHYHLLPAIVLFFCGLGMSVHTYVVQYLHRLRHAGAISVVLLLVLAYHDRPLMTAWPTHAEITALPLAEEMKKCPEPCPVFMFNGSIEVMQPTFFYLRKENASRFPTLWFIPKLVENADDPAMALRLLKYGDLVAEDLARHQPEMLVIAVIDDLPVAFGTFFAGSAAFRQQWSQYRKERQLTFNRKPYFAGTAMAEDHELTYDIYRRVR